MSEQQESQPVEQPVPEPEAEPKQSLDDGIKELNNKVSQLESKSKRKYIPRGSRIRAINNFNQGHEDPELDVCLMSNGQYRCSWKKGVPTNNPINVNQIPVNKPSQPKPVQEASPITQPPVKAGRDPFADIVYYNMSNQLSEQMNKRLDSITAEIERLRHKNSKLKGKYKTLKQALFVSDDEDEDEAHATQPDSIANNIEPVNAELKIEPEPTPQLVIPRPPIRQNHIDYNRFFR